MGDAMRAKLFRSGRSQAVRLPAPFRFEGTEVEVHRDPESGAVVLTPVRPSASALMELRDALLQEPGFREEADAQHQRRERLFSTGSRHAWMAGCVSSAVACRRS
jgi:antitoxin VapB